LCGSEVARARHQDGCGSTVSAAINAVALDATLVVDRFAGGLSLSGRDAAERDAAGQKHR